MKRDLHFGIYKSTWYCRWCGATYKPKGETDRDGFCPGGKCKMALYRAFKKSSDRALLLGARGKKASNARRK